MSKLHTKTPWEYDEFNNIISVGLEKTICQFWDKREMDFSNSQANAKFIVKAVNTHEVLVQALRVALITLTNESAWFNKTACIKTIEKALEESEGE